MMRAAQPGLMEYKLEAEFNAELAAHGQRRTAFPSIIAGGERIFYLHYANPMAALADGELILADVGAVYDEYGADISRVFPANGRFSERQALEEALSGDYAQANYSTEPLRRSSQPPPPGTEGINLGPGPALMVQFEEGRAGLSAAARADLERMAIAQSALGGAIRIVGYAGGSEGRDALKAFSLSAERAEAVAASLKRLGVPSASLVTQAVGVDPRHFGGDTLGPGAEIFLDIGQASR